MPFVQERAVALMARGTIDVMTKTKPFAELAAKVKADPERRARIAIEKRAIEDSLRSAELRSRQNVTQQELSKTLDVTQANISRVDQEVDL